MDSYGALSDLELWDMAADDPDAMGALFARHASAVHRFCVWKTGDWILADDLTSIVFLEAWKSRQKAVAVDGDSLKAWLLGVANNVTRNALRSIRRYRSTLSRLPAVSDFDEVEERAVARADAQASLDLARSALEQLDEAERNVVLLVLWSELSYDEAAVALDIPIGTVRSRLSRARKKVRGSLASALMVNAKEEP
jgi:RNA polymerase sigma factor (sigma-70 family)